jgi:hypothetical protein
MTLNFSEIIRKYSGWCPNAPTMRTAPAVLVVPPDMVNPTQPDGSRTDGGPGRIRRGIGIATGSIKTLVRDKSLLWFSFFTGLVILFLILAEGWNITHYNSILSSLIWIPFMDSTLIVFDMRLFLIEAVCMSGFTLLLAGLILYRKESMEKMPVTVHGAFAGINAHSGTLTTLSIVMALVATVLFEISTQSQVIGKVVLSISLTAFHLPYAYYIPNEVFSALYFSFQIMVINFVLFLLALYVVPGIVLENKTLGPALTGSVILMKRTWCELLGCILIFGVILLAVAAIALVIGQSPLLLNHDYDFFLQISRGQVAMTLVSYGFLIACGVLMAVGFTAAGVAITDLYRVGKSSGTSGIPEGDLKQPLPAL